jgi:hypothetical protein
VVLVLCGRGLVLRSFAIKFCRQLARQLTTALPRMPLVVIVVMQMRSRPTKQKATCDLPLILWLSNLFCRVVQPHSPGCKTNAAQHSHGVVQGFSIHLLRRGSKKTCKGTGNVARKTKKKEVCSKQGSNLRPLLY